MISQAPNLEDLVIYEMEQLTSENYKCLIAHPSLKRIYINPEPRGVSVTQMLGLTGVNARKTFEFGKEPPIILERKPELPTRISGSALDRETNSNAQEEDEDDDEKLELELAICIKLTDYFPYAENLRLYGDLEIAVDEILGEDLLGYVEGSYFEVENKSGKKIKKPLGSRVQRV